MRSQQEKAEAFRELHGRNRIFVIPNPWDVGSAKLLAHLGFEALATTSAGFAFTLGRRDNSVARDEMLAHCAAIAAATDLPVSADLERGFGDEPETVAETIRLAAATGLAGASIEDSTGRRDSPIYPLELAVERVRAAAEAARSLPFPFTLTGRCENFLVGRRDLADTIRRLQAYQEAGADVLYAPRISTRVEIGAIVSSLDRPVNVLMGMAGIPLTLAELEALGVRRVSVGAALARVAFTALLGAGREMREKGTFTFNEGAVPASELEAIFDPRGGA